jgi:predicted methyltransferase
MAPTFSSKLASHCHFRADGIFCNEGYLYYSKAEIQEHADGTVESYNRVMVEGEPVTCSVCEGRGMILTDEGREILAFFDIFLRPRVQEVVEAKLSK